MSLRSDLLEKLKNTLIYANPTDIVRMKEAFIVEKLVYDENNDTYGKRNSGFGWEFGWFVEFDNGEYVSLNLLDTQKKDHVKNPISYSQKDKDKVEVIKTCYQVRPELEEQLDDVKLKVIPYYAGVFEEQKDINGKILKERWYRYSGQLASEVEYFYDGSINRKHRVDYYPDGKYKCESFYAESFYTNEQLHNEDDYAIKTWYKNGNPKTESYFINGEYSDYVFYPHKEWSEDGRLKIDIYKENLHKTLKNEFPISIVEKLQSSYEDVYIGETNIEPQNSYYWLVEFENGSIIPYPLLALWDKQEHDEEHAIYVDEQQDIIKYYYEKRPELKEAFKEVELKHLGNMIDETKTEYTVNEVGEETERKYRLNGNLAEETLKTYSQTETIVYYNNGTQMYKQKTQEGEKILYEDYFPDGSLHNKRVYDFIKGGNATYLKEEVVFAERGHKIFHKRYNHNQEEISSPIMDDNEILNNCQLPTFKKLGL